MTKERIEELFYPNAAFSYCGAGMMDIDDFTKTINQVELELKLEWFKELHTKLNAIFSQPIAKGVELELSKYIIEIENKIKELENGK